MPRDMSWKSGKPLGRLIILGTCRPKRDVEAVLQDMEAAVSDAFTLKTTDDPVLAVLIQIATVSVNENRPVYPNPLHEPVLWRHFRRWVLTASRRQPRSTRSWKKRQRYPNGRSAASHFCRSSFEGIWHLMSKRS